MDTDSVETLFVPSAKPLSGQEGAVSVAFPLPDGHQRTVGFSDDFRIGRSEECEIWITNSRVSRQHLAVYRRSGCWWVRDLGSSNGTFENGQQIGEIPLLESTALELGNGGPLIYLTVAAKPSQQATEQQLQNAFQGIVRRYSRRYWISSGLLLAMLTGVGAVAWHFYNKNQKNKELALAIFYNMKSFELQIANFQEEVIAQLGAEARRRRLADLTDKRTELAQLRNDYESILRENLGFKAGSEPEQLIFHIARVFGECELNMPQDFVTEVQRYISKWQATTRLQRAIQRLYEKDYADMIVQALKAQQLPPQFIYLALQESNFQERIVGPRTRYGHAKGMWQFIPATGSRFGLSLGPLKDSKQYDPQDERHDPYKSTAAAAKYLKTIYRTDAQASGLLVMASYNWGEGNIIKRVRKMPQNPRDRNFWQLLKHHKIPKETYNYVFYIFSAAVIGENPGLFGFNFISPTQGLASR